MSWQQGIIGAPQWVNLILAVGFLLATMGGGAVACYWIIDALMSRADRKWHKNNARMFDAQAHQALYGDKDETK